MSRAKKAEPIKVPFEMWTHGGPKDHVLDGILIPHKKGNFEGLMPDSQYTENDSQGAALGDAACLQPLLWFILYTRVCWQEVMDGFYDALLAR